MKADVAVPCATGIAALWASATWIADDPGARDRPDDRWDGNGELKIENS
jgi:hypothetical protein